MDMDKERRKTLVTMLIEGGKLTTEWIRNRLFYRTTAHYAFVAIGGAPFALACFAWAVFISREP